jgi:hypothetical protein
LNAFINVVFHNQDQCIQLSKTRFYTVLVLTFSKTSNILSTIFHVIHNNTMVQHVMSITDISLIIFSTYQIISRGYQPILSLMPLIWTIFITQLLRASAKALGYLHLSSIHFTYPLFMSRTLILNIKTIYYIHISLPFGLHDKWRCGYQQPYRTLFLLNKHQIPFRLHLFQKLFKSFSFKSCRTILKTWVKQMFQNSPLC